MSRNTYFKDELEFLNEVRDRAASEHWDIARFLATRGSDPDVERLFEGFAFLTGRIRQKLDDEFPEIVQSMLAMWWPHYLRPIPAMSILEFKPIVSAFSESKTVVSGAAVQSKPVDARRCRFRTVRDAVLHPIALESVRLDDTGAGAELVLDVSIWPNSRFAEQAQDSLTLYLGDKHERACDLYRYLMEHTDTVEITLLKQGQEVARKMLDGRAIRPIAFAAGESTLPNTQNVTPGHLGLQEYFSFAEKYLFVEIGKMSPITAQIEPTHADSMKITVRMRRQLDWDFTRASNIVRLNCVPIVNIFDGAAKPIQLDHTRAEYRLLAEATSGMACELYAIDRVSGFSRSSDQPREFFAFESFEHHRDETTAPHYHIRYHRRVYDDGVQMSIAFVDPSADALERSGETLAIQTRCTNGSQANALDPGDICVSTATSPEFATFENVTRPTRYLAPPLDGSMLWRLVSNMSVNYTTLLETEALRAVLETYDFRGRVDGPAGRRTRRVLDSLQVDETFPSDRLVKGLPVRGISSQLSVSRSAFQSLGEVYVLGCVLREFLDSFSGINSFHELTFRDRDTDEVFSWPVNTGSGKIL